jgi:hypothetical protein
MDSAKEFFEKRLLLNRVKGKLNIRNMNFCYRVEIPPYLKSGGDGVEADLIILTTTEIIDGNFIAWATACI